MCQGIIQALIQLISTSDGTTSKKVAQVGIDARPKHDPRCLRSATPLPVPKCARCKLDPIMSNPVLCHF